MSEFPYNAGFASSDILDPSSAPHSLFHAQNTLGPANTLNNINMPPNANYWQLLYQQTQMKLSAVELEKQQLKGAYTDLGDKFEKAIEALTTTSTQLETKLKELDSLHQKLSRASPASVQVDGDSSGIGLRDNIPPPDFDVFKVDPDNNKKLELFKKKICWTEVDYGNGKSVAPDADGTVEQNKSSRYLRNKDCAVLCEVDVGLIRILIRQGFAFLAERGIKVPNYLDASLTVLRFLQYEVYSQFPEVNYCHGHWKFKRLYQAVYSSWKQKNPDLATSKELFIKAERAYSVVHARTPAPTAYAPKKTSHTRASVEVFSSPAASTTLDVTPPPSSMRYGRDAALMNSDSALTQSPSKRTHDLDRVDEGSVSKRPRTDDVVQVQYKVADALGGVLPLETSAADLAAPPSSAPNSSNAAGSLGPSGAPPPQIDGHAPMTKERAWKPAKGVTAFNVFAHEYCKIHGDVIVCSVVKAAFAALKDTGGQKKYNDRAKEIKSLKFTSLEDFFAAQRATDDGSNKTA